MPEKVSIVHCPDDDPISLTGAVAHALALLGSPLSRIRPRDRVLIKPNITAQDISWRQGVVTNPYLIRALIELIREQNPGEILVAEAIPFGLDVKKAFSFLGYDAIARETGARLVDLYDEAFVHLPVRDGKVHRSMEISRPVLEADYLIVVPVLKTHVATEISVCMKCLMGILSVEQKRKFHFSGLCQSIMELNSEVQPDLLVADGTVAGEGNGPMDNEPVGLGKVMAGTNSRAVDLVAARLMGYEPEKIDLFCMCTEQWGPLPETEIQILGESMQTAARPFKRPVTGVAPREGATQMNGNACKTCAGVIELALRRAEAMGLLDQLTPLRISYGPEASRPPMDGNNLIVGKCLSHFKETGYFVPGCPPQVFLITDGLAEMAGHERKFGSGEGYMFSDTEFLSDSG